MKSNRIIVLSILLLTLVTFLNVRAEVTLSSASEILGTWKLEHSSPRIDGAERPGNAIWEFRNDGTLVTTAIDNRATGGEFSITVNYEVKDGKIVSDQPGRSKKITYSVVEKKRNSMILHGGMDAFLFFTKQ